MYLEYVHICSVYTSDCISSVRTYLVCFYKHLEVTCLRAWAL